MIKQTSLPRSNLISNSKWDCQLRSYRWEMPRFALVKIAHSTTMIKRTDKAKTTSLKLARWSCSPRVMRLNSIEISRSQVFRSLAPETTWIKPMPTSQSCRRTTLANTPLPKKTHFLIVTERMLIKKMFMICPSLGARMVDFWMARAKSKIQQISLSIWMRDDGRKRKVKDATDQLKTPLNECTDWLIE